MNPNIHTMYHSAGARFHGIQLTDYAKPHESLMWEPDVKLIHTRAELYTKVVSLWARPFSTDETVSVEEWLHNYESVSGEFSVPCRAMIAAGRFYMVNCGNYYDEWTHWLDDNVPAADCTWWGGLVFFTREADAIIFKLHFGEQ